MLLAATLVTIFLHITVAEKSNVSRTYEYPETQIDTYYPGRDNTKLVHARCNSSLASTGKRCVITMRSNAFEETAGETSECTVNLKPELPFGLVNDSILLYVFGSDKVLLIWMETQNASKSENQIELTLLKTTIVHILGSCQTFETKVHKYLGQPITLGPYFDVRYMNTILFENTYELILGDLEDNCTSRSKCELNYRLYKFDDQNRKVCGAEYWPKSPFNGPRDFSFVVSAKFRHPEEGYLITSRNDTSLIVELMNRKSSGYQKMKLWSDSCSSSLTEFRFSLANQAIGFCYICANSSFVCWQSDQKGHIHKQTRFELDMPHKTHLSAVHTPRNGVLLLAVPKCFDSDCSRNNKYYFLKIDVKNNVKSVDIELETYCHDTDNYLFMRILENEQGDYCIVRICESKPNKPARLETSAQCYSWDEFAKFSVK